jgi:hypothetical protein
VTTAAKRFMEQNAAVTTTEQYVPVSFACSVFGLLLLFFFAAAIYPYNIFCGCWPPSLLSLSLDSWFSKAADPRLGANCFLH